MHGQPHIRYTYRIGFIFPPLRALAAAGVCHIYLEVNRNQFLWLGYLALLYIYSNLLFCHVLGQFVYSEIFIALLSV